MTDETSSTQNDEEPEDAMEEVSDLEPDESVDEDPPEVSGPPGESIGQVNAGEAGGEASERDAASLALEAEWMRTNEQEGWLPHMSPHGAGHALSPYLCLYAGFFLGPPGLLLTALLVAPKRLTLRRLGIFIGITGLAWSVVQGGTVLMMDAWSGTALFVSRATINFLAGVAVVLAWRVERPTTLLHSRESVFHTVVIGLMQLGVFMVLSRDVLWLLGR